MMNSKTAKLISRERVMELLDCYGADPQAWPEDERTTALALIQHSTELKNLQKEARKLDRFLVGDNMQPAFAGPADKQLVSRIVSSLPAQIAGGQNVRQQRDKPGRRPLFDFSNWIGMVAASVAVFVITVSIMELNPTSVSQPQNGISQAELDYWMWQQVTGEVENEDEEPLTMMALFGPE
jgi:hypothetical protein